VPELCGITGGVEIVAAQADSASIADSVLASRRLRKRRIVNLLEACIVRLLVRAMPGRGCTVARPPLVYEVGAGGL
jgi:hypothetical protein